MTTILPETMPGHWSTPEGRDMAQRSLTKVRADLAHGDMPDLELANRVYMASRTDLDLLAWQTAAKERIRWLSAQLAAVQIGLAAAPAVKALIAYCAAAPAIACGEGYWDDSDSACGDGMRQEKSEAAALIRDALTALGIDAPAGVATCPDCFEPLAEEHHSRCSLPCIAVEFVAEGVQVTARSEKEAERFANEDAGEFASSWNYRLADVEPAGEHEGQDEELGRVEIELGDGTQNGETWTFAPTFRVVVKEPDDPAAIVAALEMLGVKDAETVAAPMIVEWKERADA